MSGSNIWESVLSRIETKVNRHSFYTWFKPTSLVADEGLAVKVRVPNTLFRDWLTKHYSAVLDEALAEVERKGAQVVFLTDEAMAVAAAAPPPEDLPAPDPDATIETRPEDNQVGGLAPRYSFDTFIVGSSNQFAHAACRAVAEAPSRSYNPLFIYGGVGLGKTHLMHAIGHYVLNHLSALKLTYISSERFMNEMINAVRYDRILDFRERYRSVDVLLVDDIQFMAGKEGTQTEFFHTFNALYDSQKQIVISSDCPPHEIPSLEERLRSRFEWGLIADIQPPDLETKVAILKKKAETEGVPLPDNVAIYIAGKIKSNIRELEGSLIRLIAYASLTGTGDLPASCPGCAPQRPPARRAGRDDRGHPEIRLGLLRVEARGTEVAEQLQVDRDAAPDRDVSLQGADERVAAGNREELRRKAPLDGHPLHPEDREQASDGRESQHTYQHLHGVVSLGKPSVPAVFHRVRIGKPADDLRSPERVRLSTGPPHETLRRTGGGIHSVNARI